MSVRTFKPAKQSTESFSAFAMMRECSVLRSSTPALMNAHQKDAFFEAQRRKARAEKEARIDAIELELAIQLKKPRTVKVKKEIARLDAELRKARGLPERRIEVVVAKPVDPKKQLLAQAAAARTPQARAARAAAEALREAQEAKERADALVMEAMRLQKAREKAEAEKAAREAERIRVMIDACVELGFCPNGIVIKMEVE